MSRGSLLRPVLTTGLVALVAVLPLAGCGNPNSSSGGSLANSTLLPTPESRDSYRESPPLTGSSTSAATTVVDHFGGKCDEIPTDPTSPASFAKMGNDAAATAISHNPLTGKLYEELATAHLVEPLNQAGKLTILAPSDDAFDKLGDAKLRAIESDTKKLTRILEYQVIPKRLSPEELTGQLTTLEGSGVQFKGDKLDITVGPTGTEAHIVCGNIITQNATIYVIDTLLQPPG